MQRGLGDLGTLARLDFLMRYLAWRVDEAVARTVAAIDGDLGFSIPPGLRDSF